ncbi:MAG: hypothetical protein D6815_05405 [Candidatus Dadabacteria bacterium]|nr:MAG: hypothetical protein D6815_05405 [Candidatus Dadabacteria bacterium]
MAVHVGNARARALIGYGDLSADLLAAIGRHAIGVAAARNARIARAVAVARADVEAIGVTRARNTLVLLALLALARTEVLAVSVRRARPARH